MSKYSKRSQKTIGISASVISAMVFGMVPFFMKTIIAGGGTTLSGAFYRFALSLPVLFAVIKYKKTDMRITKQDFLKICLITIFGYGGTAVFILQLHTYRHVHYHTFRLSGVYYPGLHNIPEGKGEHS